MKIEVSLIAAIALFLGGVPVSAQLLKDQMLVHTIYLSPLEVAYKPHYKANLTSAISDLQLWYARELDGSSFSLAADPVTWFQLPQVSSYYRSPTGSYDANAFWFSVLEANHNLTGALFNEPDDTYLIYIDADQLPGQLFGGTNGIALMSANDLRGLSSETLIPINPGDAEIIANFPSGRDRFVGGLGHELGHAFNLNHPGAEYTDTIMEWGYLYYPNTTLAESQKNQLLANPFFSSDFTVPIPEPQAAILITIAGAVIGYRLARRRINGA